MSYKKLFTEAYNEVVKNALVKEQEAQKLKEQEKDHEISMARGELEAIADKALKLSSMLQGKSDEGNPLEAWVQSKITKAKDYINSVSDYMGYNPDMNEMFGISSNAQHRAKVISMLDKEKIEYEKSGLNGLIIKGVSKDKQQPLLDRIKKEVGMFNTYVKDEVELEEATYGWTLVSKAKDLAKKFANNYTKAVDEIEKLQKGLSKNVSVEKELLKYNENKEGRPSPANPTGKDIEEATSHTVRFTDPLNKKKFAIPFKTHKAAEDKMAQLKRDGVKEIKITMDELKPGIKFKD
jgi:hypothetical protein